MSLSSPHQMLLDICDREFGFQPLNFSIKPVHVANGLVRALTKRSYKTDALASTLRRYVVRQALNVEQECNPNNEILENYKNAFAQQPNLQRLGRFRALSLAALGADNAVFPSADKSSYTLSNERFVTKDPSDRHTGQFLAHLLQVDHTDTVAARVLLDLVKTEHDGWTTLALPLFQFGKVREENSKSPTAEQATTFDSIFAVTDGNLNSPILNILRACYDRLALFEIRAGSKLNSLRRLVLFGCFVLHVHAISRRHERNPDLPRPPILLDMLDGKVKSVRDASRASLRAAGDSIEFLILDCFKEEIASYRGIDTEMEPSKEDLLAVLRENDADTALVETLSQSEYDEKLGAVDALAQAIFDVAFAKLNEHPIGSLIELGRRAGFLAPWANSGRGGKLRKRYTATAEFLETLVAATVELDEPVELREFLDRLRNCFGILVGQHDDGPSIVRNNLTSDTQFGVPTSINEHHLIRNVEALSDLLVETGYGKRYADGLTIVTSKPAVHL